MTMPIEYPNCVVCKVKHQQLKNAITSGNGQQIRDINQSLAQHLRNSHVREVSK